MEQCIGQLVQLKDVPEIILGLGQELLLYDIIREPNEIDASVENQRLVFGKMVETMIGQEDVERTRQARGERPEY